MRVVALVAGLALTACSAPHASNSSADVDAAAAQAQGDIDTYAANTLAAPKPVAPIPAQAVVALPVRPGTVAETPFVTDSAQGAADVVQTYFALIEAGKYGQAWALWGDDGRASGMTRTAFAASFAKYADYHAEVGAPGDVEAGAGQRYVTVPVRAYGTLAQGKRPFNLRGTLTLHRTEIDGATPDQRRWRISDSSLKPRQTEAAAQPATVTARYNCAGETRISVRFDNDADTATVRRGGRDLAVLDGQRPASGIWYKGGGYELRGKGDAADFTAPGRPAVACSTTD